MNYMLLLNKEDSMERCWEEEVNALSVTFSLSCHSKIVVQTSPVINVLRYSIIKMRFFPLPRKLMDLMFDIL